MGHRRSPNRCDASTPSARWIQSNTVRCVLYAACLGNTTMTLPILYSIHMQCIQSSCQHAPILSFDSLSHSRENKYIRHSERAPLLVPIPYKLYSGDVFTRRRIFSARLHLVVSLHLYTHLAHEISTPERIASPYLRISLLGVASTRVWRTPSACASLAFGTPFSSLS